MRENIRLYATLIIWFAFTIVTTVIFTASDAIRDGDPNTPVFIALIFAFAAAISTVTIWMSAVIGDSSAESSHAAQAKRKNVERGRMERLVERLSDDELYELETLLVAHSEHDAAEHESQ